MNIYNDKTIKFHRKISILNTCLSSYSINENFINQLINIYFFYKKYVLFFLYFKSKKIK